MIRTLSEQDGRRTTPARCGQDDPRRSRCVSTDDDGVGVPQSPAETSHRESLRTLGCSEVTQSADLNALLPKRLGVAQPSYQTIDDCQHLVAHV